ncbi:effector-associated domain EAD1-containing protein [Nocardia sp. NPDC056611]|uniref:effector-associated domain EAD1-containing protein n=1 Tax=Nocardia sp. NPDC056611 TaxID=3345877 RepID=UPI00366C305F
MSFLDRRPFDASDPQARELVTALGNGYPRPEDAHRLLSITGIPKQDIFFGQPMSDVWLSICETAANRGLLRTLVAEASKDHRVPGYAIFRTLVDTPVSDSHPPSHATEVRAKSRRFRLLGVLAILVAIVVYVGVQKLIGKGSGDSSGANPATVALKIYDLGQSKGELTFVFPPEVVDKATEFAERVRNDAQPRAGDKLIESGWYAGHVKVVLEVTNSSDREIDILDVRPVNRQRSPIKLGTVIWVPPGGGGPEDNSMWFGLDYSQPTARSGAGFGGNAEDPAFFESRLLGINPGGRKVLSTYFFEDSAAVSFDIEVEYREAGADRSDTQAISNHGHPFQVTAWPCPTWLRRHNVAAAIATDIGNLRYGSVLKKIPARSGNGWEMQEMPPDDYAAACGN